MQVQPFKEIDWIFGQLNQEKRWLSEKWIDDILPSDETIFPQPILTPVRVSRKATPVQLPRKLVSDKDMASEVCEAAVSDVEMDDGGDLSSES